MRTSPWCGTQRGAAAGGGAVAAAPQPDEAIVASLVSMGFSENGSKRAGACATLTLSAACSMHAA